MADASHDTESGFQLALDYGFSLLNLGLAALLYWLRPRDRTAPLLAFGLVGTAAVFNLQSNLVYETLDPTAFETFTHDAFHVVAALSYVLALLVFPDGHLVPRWRRGPLVVLYLALIPAVALFSLRIQGDSRTVLLVSMFGLLTPVAGVLAQAYRYGRPQDAVERQQSKLLFWALTPALFVSLFALASAGDSTSSQFEGRELLVLPVTLFRIFQPVFFLIPVALLVGIFRFRLWSVDRLISRTLVYSLLAGFVSAVYITVVVGLGSLIGQQQNGNLGLSIAATFLVAVTFAQVRERVQRLADRLVYGRRASPYEVLSQFSERVGESVPADELLSRMAAILGEGTSAARADVWLKVGDELRRTASWSSSGAPPPDVAPVPAGLALPPLPDVTTAVAVRHQGELFGALSLRKPGAEELSPTEQKLVEDLARQAGLVMRNLRLTAELLDRLEELKASRKRLVSAQNEARRRLERNLHDGAQQHLVALKVHITLAEDLADELGPEGEQLIEVLSQLKVQAGEALEELRDLAHGIYPPLLAAEGLEVALRSQARKVKLPVEVQADGVERYEPEVEAAVYFCCLEALQNITKYAGPCEVIIRLEAVDDEFRFTVTDNGCGFDLAAVARGAGTQNMADRLESLDGSLHIQSEIGVGTTISGTLPVADRRVAATAPA
jgi:signal transduction histidine kinase